MTAADYAMHVPDTTQKILFSPGKWNSSRIIFTAEKVEHWLNGTRIVKYTYGSDEMWALVAKSKFNSMPLFAKASEGHIGLQGDHGEIWYRNIRIRKL